MSTNYLCVHCDKSFVHEGSKKPRCPECMRVNGLEEVVAPKESRAERPPWFWWAVAAAVLAVAGGGYAYWSANESVDTVSGDAPIAPLDRSLVLGHLRSRGVDARQLGTMLIPEDAVESFAETAAGSANGPQAKAAAILEAIRAHAAEGAFERWSLGIPRETPITGSTQVLESVEDDGAHHHLYPLEVAALLVAALRAVDVPAMVAEAIRYEGDRSPPDPSGQFGYFVAAVWDGEPGEGDPTFYDAYLGRETQPSETRVLTDLEAIGAAMNTRALYLLSRESDPERAVEASGAALRLDGRSPSNRAVRGAIMLASGRPDEGLDELSSARQLRTDAPRRNLLASVHFAQGDLDAASREIAAALEEYPEFAPGHATLAGIHLARSENDLARSELEEAQRIDPQLHMLPQLWAGYFAQTGDLDRAVQRAQQAVELNGDIQTRLMAARIYRQASRYDMMRREAHAVLARTPSQRAPEMRQLIQRMLGPTALEPLEEDDEELGEEGDEEFGLGDPDSLTLDSPLLGSGSGDGPSLLGGSGGGSPGLLGGGGGGLQLGGGGGPQLGGGGGGLQLGGGGGDGLQLDLDD